MTPSSESPTILLWVAGCIVLFVLQVHQASRFMRLNDGPPLTWPLITPVLLIYLLTSSWMMTLVPVLSSTTVLRSLALLILAVPLTLTDLRCQWLPMRYTVLFWLGGLVSSAMPGAVVELAAALQASITAFGLTGVVRWLANGDRSEERIGLGDVYLMAGLCAWLPWQSACYAAAGGLLICCLSAAITRQPSKPFAPALFGYLCGVCLLFPQQLTGVL